MKLLHTSDWHIGKTLRGRPRTDEHEAVLDEIVAIARAEMVDAILVVGDVFDSASPSPEAERVAYRALLGLAGTGAPVFVVAGNHDNERRLAAIEPLLGLGHVVSRATPARASEGGVVEVTVRSGGLLRLALLPFVSQRAIVKATDLMTRDADEHAGSYAQRLRLLVDALTAGFTADAVNVVVAHLTVVNGLMGGGERQAHTIFDYCVDPSIFPASAHYVALGHLHRPQRIPGACPIWYSGSPLHLDFGEAPGAKSVLLVDCEPGVPATVREVTLSSGRRLQTLRGTLAELDAIAGTTGDDFLRIYVRERVRVGLADEVRDRFPHAVDVIVEPVVDVDADRRTSGDAMERFALAPAEQFRAYLAERNIDDGRLVALFQELLDEAATNAA